MLSWVRLLQAPLSIGFPRQEYWNRLPFPSPGVIFSFNCLNISSRLPLLFSKYKLLCLPAPAYFSSLLLISKNQFYLYFFHELSHLSFQTISVSLMTVHTSIMQILCPILKYQVYSFQLLWVLFLIFFLIITLYGVIILSPFFSYKINIPIWGGLVAVLLFK